ncbi:LysM peptidoglycan-binding domain-containing protein [Paenibacillus melissococcoides]|uniref:LysM peptidoglycan-binding domain-containing protein n=1 Tax=Paenibacillus melissococcoides TaxID=2912268 RepID=A0ABN8U6Y6_9BACL|nr:MULTISPECIES: LysM peptidoglycan-binding domain-containing protein [Paenibacillus]CAH8246827.1 LysM peptidoglycan-binding domain-containing protein [Paenibacillus melissococcoides]CAH8715875.1 LysM peptidoglycan-binding domain-containing protein [Paenibacillus melissococcoides]CAH8716830.1 LysM peptidoglycan-binding domain-containing protein [Paenibacillus melissococcoides]
MSHMVYNPRRNYAYRTEARSTMHQPVKQKCYNRRKLIRAILLFGLLFLLCAGIVQAWGDDDTVSEQPSVVTERVLVQPGDSLWEIATVYKPNGMDTREYIHKIIQLNELRGHTLQSGIVIVVPIFS